MDMVLTPTDTFSTDTAPLTYSSTYTLSTLANAPVGTYITYTYAINTNTRTQTSTRPAQTDADMNTNGILLYTRAYNAASTAAQPATMAIQIGKGMKGVATSVYKSSGKTTSGVLEPVVNGFTETGAKYVSYNEITGVLVIDLGTCHSSSNTAHLIGYSDDSGTTNGYVVINASKNPALTGMNLNRVAAKWYNTSALSIPNSTLTTITGNTTTYDTHGVFNPSTGLYTVPETGYYNVWATHVLQWR